MPWRPQRLQVVRQKHSDQAGWGWATDVLIRSISIRTPLSPSSALPPNGLSGAGSRVNGLIGGGKQITVSTRVMVTEWREFPLHAPLPPHQLPESMHKLMQSILSR